MQSRMRACSSVVLVLFTLLAAGVTGCRERAGPAAEAGGAVEAGVAAAESGAATPAAEPAATGPVTVTDDAGRVIRLAAPARRIVSLAPSHTEIVYAIGAGDRLVGRTPACDHPPAAAAVPPVGDLFPPAWERILGADAELVLMAGGSLEVRRRLEGHGLTVAVFDPRTLPAVADAMRRIGVLAGVDAEPAAACFEAALAAASRPAGGDAPRVFYEVGFEPLYGAGPEGFVGDLIRRAGGANALGRGEWPRVETEQLVAANPGVMVVGNPARRDAIRVAPPAGWAVIDAVARGQVVAVPDADLFVRPGPRVVEGLAWMRATLDAARAGSR